MLIFVVNIRPARTFWNSTHCLLSPFTLDWSRNLWHNPMWNMVVNNISYPIYQLSTRIEKGYITKMIPFFFCSVYYWWLDRQAWWNQISNFCDQVNKEICTQKEDKLKFLLIISWVYEWAWVKSNACVTLSWFWLTMDIRLRKFTTSELIGNKLRHSWVHPKPLCDLGLSFSRFVNIFGSVAKILACKKIANGPRKGTSLCWLCVSILWKSCQFMQPLPLLCLTIFCFLLFFISPSGEIENFIFLCPLRVNIGTVWRGHIEIDMCSCVQLYNKYFIIMVPLTYADSDHQMDVEYYVVSNHLLVSRVQDQESLPNGDGQHMTPSHVIFTGYKLEESQLKDWMRTCAKQVILLYTAPPHPQGHSPTGTGSTQPPVMSSSQGRN